MGNETSTPSTQLNLQNEWKLQKDEIKKHGTIEKVIKYQLIEEYKMSQKQIDETMMILKELGFRHIEDLVNLF